MNDLPLLAMVGIVDPPRPEARDAIAQCHRAGIQVRMITGDHAVTAAAIGKELGITGRALTGAQFKAMSAEQLMKELPDIGVIARVAPEDKIRLVDLLQRQQNIVAMTGDGVNDAPALKKADIGVAMGITGTEVSKDAAVMILTDDNFATIVKAVEFGRAIYDNLSKYIRFQMGMLAAFILSYLGAAVFGILGGVPFSPAVVLFVNFLIQVPIAIALGFDKPMPGLMDRKPRPLSQPVLSRSQWVRLIFTGFLIALGTLALERRYEAIDPALAATMGFAVFALFNIVFGLSARSETGTVFTRDTVGDRRQLKLYGLALLLTLLGAELGILQRILNTVSLTFDQWLLCIGLAFALLLVDEAIKFFMRRRRPQTPPAAVEPAAGRLAAS
ncbi:MAG TPA: HAD-IC family P-type ATPase, partial [Promineifilum sp.]|nr:HAD-IC family P-type ATPase [Promineifilum sp.]